MGGCCCCSSKGAERNSTPVYYYVSVVFSLPLDIFLIQALVECFSCVHFDIHFILGASLFQQYPRASEERLPLSSHHGASSALSRGLLVDTNLETSVPDAYRPPPAPTPFDANVRHPQTPPVVQEICSNKSDPSVQTTPVPVQDTLGGNSQETSSKCDDLKEPESKTVANVELESTKELEVELSKSVHHVVAVIEEEDVCPTCLEEYDAENPRIITKCEHHFHLACIFEWMERSDTCPVCNQEMIFDLPVDY